MSLYGALYSSVAGLRSQSNKIGILSDNISNVNTVGYKKAEGQFESLVTNSGLVSAYSPGGVLSVNRQLVSKQGLLQGTDNSTDVAITGRGFFVVSDQSGNAGDPDEGEVLYTRAGSFRQDNLGNFRNASGFYLKGWPLDREGRLPGEPGNLNTTSANNLTSLETINVQQATGSAAETTTVDISANLKASQTIFPGADATAGMDTLTVNFAQPAKSIIVPGALNGTPLTTDVNHIERGDKVVISTGNGLSYTYRYGGFTFGRDAATGNNGDSGVSLQTSPLTLLANAFAVTASNQTITVTAANHGLQTGEVVTISGQAAAVGGVPAADLNQSFVITSTGTNTFTITVSTPTASITGGTAGTAGVSVVTRPFAGNILDAVTINQRFFTTTSTANFTAAALTFSINTTATGPVTFTYTNSTPNAQLRQFNTLSNLADAINSVSGLTARVSNGRLFVGAADANAAVTFANGSTVGQSGPPVLDGLDWVRELGLSNVGIGDDRFNSLQSLASLINASTGLDASISNSLTEATMKINVEDPLDTISFADLPVAAPLAAFATATPFVTVSGSNVVTVNHPSPHGLKTEDIVTLDVSGLAAAGPFNGIPKANFSGQFVITVTGPSSYTITVATAATASSGTGDTGLIVTPPNNSGSLLAELGLVDSLNGAAFVPQTLGPIGPEYDPGDSDKNMASGAIVPQYSQNVRIYDSLGSGHDVKVSLIKTAVNSWAVEIYAANTADVSATFANGLLAFGTLTFNGDGSLRSVSAGLAAPINIPWANGAEQSSITYNWGTAGEPFGTVGATAIGKTDGMTQFDAAYKVNFVNQNGASVGQLISVSIDEDGFVSANFSNGETQRLYQLAIADFSNPDQMDMVTGNVMRQSGNSGEANLKRAGTNGAGSIQPSALETSNVDLSEELTNLIVAQRAYQANTKLITTADNLLEGLNNTIR